MNKAIDFVKAGDITLARIGEATKLFCPYAMNEPSFHQYLRHHFCFY